MLRIAPRAGTLLLVLCSTPLAGQGSSRRVIDAAAIARAGWHRLGDVATALPPGATSSVDGFNHELSGSRLGFISTTGSLPTWLVRLDGQQMPMRIAGMWMLDLIPVAITQIDSIVIDEAPSIADGRAELLGTIDLFTRRLQRASAIGDYQHGDETGDPGPYRYTPRATPNVEKIGPFTSAAGGFGTDAVSVDGAVRYMSMNITDQRLVSRIGPSFSALQSDVNASGGSGVIAFNALGGTHYLTGGRGRFTGFMYQPSLDAYFSQGRVVATEGGASGSGVSAGRKWRYAATATELDAQRLDTVPLTVLPGTRRFVDAFVETEVIRPIHAGLGWSSAHLDSPAPAFQLDRTSARGWIGYSGNDASAEVAATRTLGRTFMSGVARAGRLLADSIRLQLVASALGTPRFSYDDSMDRRSVSGGLDSASGMSVLDFRAEIAARSMLFFKPTVYARWFEYMHTGATDRLSGVAFGLVAATTPQARISGTVRAEISPLVGDAADSYRSTPTGFAEAMVWARAPGGFDLGMSGRYAPSTEWPPRAFTPAEDLPSTRRADISANKWMWHDRVRAQLVMRNLFDVADRTHPSGAQWNLRTHLAVTIALPSGSASR